MGMNKKDPGSASTTPGFVFDTGPYMKTPEMTKVGGVRVKAAFEIQSTEGGFLPPRMTTAERVALNPIVDGLQVFDTDEEDFFTVKGGDWSQQSPSEGMLFASGALDRANFIAMHTIPKTILPAPGLGLMNIVHGFKLTFIYTALFTDGGPIYLQYGVSPGATAKLAPAAPDIDEDLLKTTTANQASYVSGLLTEVRTDLMDNQPITITNSGLVFNGGVGSSVEWAVWYSIVEV